MRQYVCTPIDPIHRWNNHYFTDCVLTKSVMLVRVTAMWKSTTCKIFRTFFSVTLVSAHSFCSNWLTCLMHPPLGGILFSHQRKLHYSFITSVWGYTSFNLPWAVFLSLCTNKTQADISHSRYNQKVLRLSTYCFTHTFDRCPWHLEFTLFQKIKKGKKKKFQIQNVTLTYRIVQQPGYFLYPTWGNLKGLNLKYG